jgi:Zn-dependent M28 family amino/carboxypeptidase
MNKRSIALYLVFIGFLLLLVSGWYAAAFNQAEVTQMSEEPPTNIPSVMPMPSSTATPGVTPVPGLFDGTRAYEDVRAQVDLGARSPGTPGHAQLQEYIRTELESAGWIVDVQNSERMGHPIKNIIAKRNDSAPQIILGAHYDTRLVADQDPDKSKRGEPVPGANDGASGVAVLLELARVLPKDTVPVWLVFFDTEDNGHIEGWDWILGSRAFAEEVEVKPRAVVIVDMIGDADLNIYFEMNSDRGIRAEIWSTAEKLGYGKQFIAVEKFSMEDDHTPFLEKGITAVDLIDFDYPYWHTTQDTLDKISAESLRAVGDTLWHWVVEQK